MTSDRVFEAGFKVGWWAFFVAEKLPYRWLRFIGMILACFITMPCVFLTFPFLVLAVILQIWEHAR